jgi:hypothetical protein
MPDCLLDWHRMPDYLKVRIPRHAHTYMSNVFRPVSFKAGRRVVLCLLSFVYTAATAAANVACSRFACRRAATANELPAIQLLRRS